MSGHRIFLSSTRKDLENDCIPLVLQAIRRNAIPVEQASWTADFDYRDEPALVCRQKVRDSTHYLGIFAYYRGSEVPELGNKSYTEAEFDWALEGKKPMAVMLPNELSEFAAELRLRAREQPLEKEENQRRFLARVTAGGGTVAKFDGAAELGFLVHERILFWNAGGFARAAAAWHARRQEATFIPSEEQILDLGRGAHVQAFRDSLDAILMHDFGWAAAFLIHGADGYGHGELGRRLLREFAGRKVDLREIRIAVSPCWDQNTLVGLVGRIGLQLGIPELRTVADLAREVRAILSHSDIFLELANLDCFSNAPEMVFANFWNPLVQTIGPDMSRRIVGVFHWEGELGPGWQPHLVCAGEGLEDTFDGSKGIALPALKPFTDREIASWLTDILPDHARNLARWLYDKTQGRPRDVYHKLRNPDFWNAMTTEP